MHGELRFKNQRGESANVNDNQEIQTRPFGRRLSDFWLKDGQGVSDPNDPPRYGAGCKLYPAEWSLLEFSACGDSLELADTVPPIATDQNLIRAGILRFIALGGDENHPLHSHGVQIRGGFIEGKLDFVGTNIPENFKLLFCRVAEELNFRDCRAETITLSGCIVKGVRADRLETSGSIHMRKKFHAVGQVRLPGSKIGGNLDCNSGQFDGPFICDGLRTSGSVFLRSGFVAKGGVRFSGAKIGRMFSCRSGKFLCAQKSLQLESAEIEGALFLDKEFLALGSVDLTNTTVGANLRCTDGTFSAPEKAIHAPNIKVANSVYLNGECRVRSEISFQSAQIGDSITFEGGSFETKGAINLRNASVGNMVTWRGVEYMRGELNFASASCNSLNMDEKAWFQPSQIRLDNFVYDRFAELPEGCTPEFWKRWLERQPDKHLNGRFRPNPYQHLAHVLETMGHEEEAREVRIEQRERQRLFSLNHVAMPRDPFRAGIRHLANFWRWVQKKAIGHGYRPGFAVIWLLTMVVVGAGIYEWAAWKGIMTPTHPLIFKEAVWKGDVKNTPLSKIPKDKIPIGCRENWVYPKGDKLAAACAARVPSEYSTFSSIIYSLDTAIPVVNFRMENDWSPRVVHWETGNADWKGWMVRSWEWVQIGLGWALSLLFVSAISGVIRRD